MVTMKAVQDLLSIAKLLLARLDLEASETSDPFPGRALRDNLRSAIKGLEISDIQAV